MPPELKPNKAEIELAARILYLVQNPPETTETTYDDWPSWHKIWKRNAAPIAKLIATRRETCAQVAEEPHLDAMSIAQRIRNMES